MGRKEDEYKAGYEAGRSGGLWDDISEGLSNQQSLRYKGYQDGVRDRDKFGRRDKSDSLFKSKPASRRESEDNNEERDAAIGAFARKMVRDREINEIVEGVVNSPRESQKNILRRAISYGVMKNYTPDCEKCEAILERAVNMAIDRSYDKKDLVSGIVKACIAKAEEE